MLRIYLKSASSHGIEIRPVATLARPIDVLRQASLVALYELVASRTHRPSCRQSEAELAERRGLARHGQTAEAGPGHRELPGRRDEVDVVAAAGDEGVHQTRRGGLDTAMEGKGAANDRELHACALAFAITRSMSGKRSRRAD